jgi:hypothetical protein
VLYAGQVRIEADPYSGFDENVTRLRVEGNVLMHVRDVNGAYEIAPGS